MRLIAFRQAFNDAIAMAPELALECLEGFLPSCNPESGSTQVMDNDLFDDAPHAKQPEHPGGEHFAKPFVILQPQAAMTLVAERRHAKITPPFLGEAGYVLVYNAKG